MTDGTWVEVSDKSPIPEMKWDFEKYSPHSVLSQIGPAFITEPFSEMTQVHARLQKLTGKASSAFTACEKFRLAPSRLQTELFDDPALHAEGSLEDLAEETPEVPDRAQQQLDDIRDALRESKRLGESSERRLKQLRQQ